MHYSIKSAIMTLMAIMPSVSIQAQNDGYDDLIAATLAAQIHQDSIDRTNLVAVYDYSCQTQDGEGKDVTDRMKVCLQVGQHCTRSYPYRKFREDTEGISYLSEENYSLLRAESYCYVPEVWTNYPDGQMTVRDAVPPIIYEAREQKQPIEWTLIDDTLTIGDYLCKTAACQLHGRTWTVRYAEDIPTPAGPWKLSGLPGLILMAEADGGVHRFVVADIQHIASPVYYEHNAITTKTTNQKLNKMRLNIFGSNRFVKDPLRSISPYTADEIFTIDGIIINNVLLPDKPHIYQPLELK